MFNLYIKMTGSEISWVKILAPYLIDMKSWEEQMSVP